MRAGLILVAVLGVVAVAAIVVCSRLQPERQVASGPGPAMGPGPAVGEQGPGRRLTDRAEDARPDQGTPAAGDEGLEEPAGTAEEPGAEEDAARGGEPRGSGSLSQREQPRGAPQGDRPSGQGAEGRGPGQGRGGGRGGMFRIFGLMSGITQLCQAGGSTAITASQATKLLGICREIESAETITPEQMQGYAEAMSGVLTQAQRDELERIREERMAQRGSGQGGPPGGPGGFRGEGGPGGPPGEGGFGPRPGGGPGGPGAMEGFNPFAMPESRARQVLDELVAELERIAG